jgi:hypothetical protein
MTRPCPCGPSRGDRCPPRCCAGRDRSRGCGPGWSPPPWTRGRCSCRRGLRVAGAHLAGDDRDFRRRALAEMRQEGLHGEEHAGDIDGEGVGPCRRVEPVCKAHALVEIDARVADKQVDGAPRKPIGQGGDGCRFAQIERCVGARPGGGDDLLPRGTIGPGQARADATIGARDQDGHLSRLPGVSGPG